MGNPETDRKKRQTLRKQLRAEGLDEALIAKIVEAKAWEQMQARHGVDGARDVRYAEAQRRAGHGASASYRPTPRDPLLHGPARATGDTARAVKSRRGLARWQVDGAEGAHPT